MIISVIAAMSDNRVIGREGAIPWDIPADRTHFREITMGHPVIMGRRTFQSIGGRLQGRVNIVLSRDKNFEADGCRVAESLEEAILTCPVDEEIFICGGEELYTRAMAIADNIYLTLVHANCRGDVYFPPIPECFKETSRREVAGDPPFAFITYRRLRGVDADAV